MTKKPIGRPKKPEQEKKVTLTVAVKKKHARIFKAMIDNLAKAYQ